MIHHRPQGFDQPLLARSGLIDSAAVGTSMVLALRLPLAESNAGIIGGFKRNASIRIDGDGKVFVTVPSLRTSQGIYTSIPMLIAAQLGVALNQVHIERSQPKQSFASNGTSGPPTIDNSGAVRGALKLLSEAAATARLMLIAAGAERWAVNARSCHADEGEVIQTSTWRKFRYGELTIDAAHRPIPNEVELRLLRVETRAE